LEREFPQLLNWEKEPHDAVIIPDSFIYGIAHKVLSISNLLQKKMIPKFHDSLLQNNYF